MVHFPSNLRFLRKRSGKTQDGLSSELGIGRTTIANYESGVSEPNMETLLTFAKYFGVDIGEMIAKNVEKDGIGSLSASNTKVIPLYKGQPQSLPHVITVAPDGDENILYVPVKARAGYLLGYGDPEFVESLTSFRLPGLTNATYRMFEVEGPSMAPNIMSGDRIIGEWVDGVNGIIDNHVHVVVHTGGVAVKRVLNRVKDTGKILLKSDTVMHRAEYPIVEIAPEDVVEIWYGRLKLSSDFSEPSELQYRLADMEVDILNMKKKIGGE
jgi:transcriptional regulator with XRE-family HTH domain/signal peptidase I